MPSKVAIALLAALGLLVGSAPARGFDINSRSNLVNYWGQDSFGVTHAQAKGSEKTLEEICSRDEISQDVFVLAFLNTFNAGTDKPPTLDFSHQCTTKFPNTELLQCPDIARGIRKCQARGKVVLLSLGGAVGLYGFKSDEEGRQFADKLWNMFFAGRASNELRPLGDTVLDGIDLDIEGGSPTGYVAMIERLRELYNAKGGGKRYYIAAAPQCTVPDFYMQPILDKTWFDMVFVQFYNNYCGLNNPQSFNFDLWDQWARTKAINKNTKVYLGVPGGPTAAGAGYVGWDQLQGFIDTTRAKYSSFGGVMMWDASQAMNTQVNGISLAQQTSRHLKSSSGPVHPSPPQDGSEEDNVEKSTPKEPSPPRPSPGHPERQNPRPRPHRPHHPPKPTHSVSHRPLTPPASLPQQEFEPDQVEDMVEMDEGWEYLLP
ncbi:Chitinase 2 [Dimargaris verticillata]|uniref:chitinase n=1 Tax=Dimargaris verticillata TaxID=2761393 RepID=A0A9W8EBM5_9FUNG|nr:Chitinase 2 [Dimargaris verticillata]